MGPFLALLVILLFFATISTKIYLDYQVKRPRAPEADRSLTTGELEELIRAAVEEETAALKARLERTEARLARLDAGTAPDAPGLLEEPAPPVRPESSRTRTR